MLRHLRLRAIALTFVAAALLGTPARAQNAETVFPPSSRIGMVPPPGFVTIPNIPGFRHGDKAATILLAELPGYAYETIDKQIAADLEKDTPVPTSRTEITLKDGSKGFILFGRPTGPQGQVLRWTLVARINDFTAVVTAAIPEQVQEVASDEVMRTALQTVAVRPAVPVDEQLSVLPFAMGNLGGFRIVRVQPGSAAMLTDGPKDPVDVAEQPLLIISIQSAPNQPPPNERDGYARRVFAEMAAMKDVRVVRSEPLRVAGQQGHEIVVEAKDSKTETDVQAVQWLRFGAGSVLRIVGIARKDAWPATFARFRSVRDGIGPK